MENTMNKAFHFLVGLPYSGTCVLSSLLQQHPDLHVEHNSELCSVMGVAYAQWKAVSASKPEEEVHNLMRGMINSSLERASKPVFIDKCRGWLHPESTTVMEQILQTDIKMVATVRSAYDCASSIIRAVKPQDLQNFLVFSPIMKSLRNYYALLKQRYETAPETICIVDYDDLIQSPQKQLDRISEFLGVSKHKYDPNNIGGDYLAESEERDWGTPPIHHVAKRLSKQHNISAKDVLSYHFDSFDPAKFWKGESSETHRKKKIDISVDLTKEGKIDEAFSVLLEAQKERPFCNKIAFNMGWFALRDGKLQEGMHLLARGRFENTFGNPKPPVPTPMWDGKSMGTVLYNLEGGLGDQIHALKYIEDINRRGCDVIVACSGELFPIVKACNGVKLICQHEAAGGVYHDFWVPAMSALIPLGYEYKDINGKPYIPRTYTPKNTRPVIGVRWQGNPKFEDEQHRRFPLEPFFAALKQIDADFICLQRDVGEEDCPDFIRKVALNDWEQTREVISGCDLVISSCTSVAHLSGAMGVPTWVIVPVLNYYIWAISGEKTPYYDSVRLFRQERFGDWSAPIEKLGAALKDVYGKETNETDNSANRIFGFQRKD
jgi:hypothetical protein